MKQKIISEIELQLDELFDISKDLYEHPEISEQEFRSSKNLVDYLTSKGFETQYPAYDIETAFKAVYDSGKPGPNIAYMCEYDALPEVGHGCGHNLICTMSIGAALGLKSVLNKTGGKITLFGTPAEETSGVKGLIGEKGAYDDVSVAMIAHPSPISEESGCSLALQAISFEYSGKTAHAAAQPEKGINALDSVIHLFNGINALRQHVPSSVRMHGIVKDGGAAPNIVPDYASANFYFRAPQKAMLEKVVEKVLSCAEGAAKMTGATMKWHYYELSYDDLVTNRSLSDIFTENLKSVGETTINAAGDGIGSIDMGNVSHFVPAIHPWIGMDDASLIIHSREFANRTVTSAGREALRKGACALALTGYDILTSEEKLEKIKEEFNNAEK